MSITFHKSRDDWRNVLASLKEGEIHALNAALKENGSGVFIDPYGDTKMTDAHISRVLALPEDKLTRAVKDAFDKLKNLEVVYVRGE